MTDPSAATPEKPHPRIDILGVPISVLSLDTAFQVLSSWIRRGRPRYVCVADVHSVMRAGIDETHMASMRGADMITPDGTPLVWISKLRGERRIQRVCGPDLLPFVCERAVDRQWKHYFFGGAEGVADSVAATLQKQFPGLQVVGTHCPPFRPLSDAEDAAIVDEINTSGADIVWVGLGCPKQERWMAEHASRLPGAILIGIGAAFDFHAARVHRAPRWMQRNGLEWLHRLLSEPQRLWRRYLVLAPKFAALALAQAARIAFGPKNHLH